MRYHLTVISCLVSAALLLGFGGCTEDTVTINSPSQSREVTFSGRVVGLEDGVPIAGAAVALPGVEREATTDERGEFRLASLVPGSYRCTVQAEGRLGVTSQLNLDSLTKAETDHIHLDIAIPARSRSLAFRLVSGLDIQPVPGVAVSLASVGATGAGAGFELLADQAGLAGVTDDEGQVVLTGLPAWDIVVAVAGADLDDDGQSDLAGLALTMDLRAAGSDTLLVVMPPVQGGQAPVVVVTNFAEYGETVTDPVVFLEFDRPMTTDMAVTDVQFYNLNTGQYDASWVSETRLEIAIREPVSRYVELYLRVFSAEGVGQALSYSFNWLATPGIGTGTGSCDDPVIDLAVENFISQIDFDTRTFELAWSAIPCADGYLVYARDDRDNGDWIIVAAIADDFDSGLIRASVVLPAVFDRFQVDTVVTPLADTIVEFCVVPANAVEAIPGPPHGTVTVSDQKAPSLWDTHQAGMGNNLFETPVTLDLVVIFSEYVAVDTAAPTLVVQEAGGDPAFALDPADGTWAWDPGQKSGRFRFVLQPGQNAGNDLYEVTVNDLADLSGNVAAGVQTSGQTEIQGTYLFDFENGPGFWTVTGTGWELGTPTSGPNGAYSGVNCWATTLGGNYANSTNTSLVSPEIVVGPMSPALRYYAWFSTESCCDRMYVEVDSGSGWQHLLTQQGSSPAWQQYTVDLSVYAGQTVHLRYRFTTDGSVTSSGVYLDSIEIR